MALVIRSLATLAASQPGWSGSVSIRSKKVVHRRGCTDANIELSFALRETFEADVTRVVEISLLCTT